MVDRIVPINSGQPPRSETRDGYDFLFKKEWYPYNKYWDKANLPVFVGNANALQSLNE
jgi:hypothetical protein